MATLIRPHTASSIPSPNRPQTSHSTRSTIRRVTPSPDSLSEALHRGFASASTPRLRSRSRSPPLSNPPDAESVRPRTAGSQAPHRRDFVSQIPKPAAGLRRSGAGRISPTKRGVSLRKYRPLSTPSPLPSHREVSHQIAPAMTAPLGSAPLPPSPTPSRPETPTPMTADQRRAQYASLGGSPTLHAAPDEAAEASDSISPAPLASTKQATSNSGSFNPTRQARNASVSTGAASYQTTFSTPGRDELERKKVESHMGPFARDEGPFGTAKSVKDLEERRRRVSEGSRRGEERKKGLCGCGLRCVVM
ncbi:hypothetical protein BU26DRAFT_564754 [Trematosphaeria pertusa]|uniref:Uncharacterized protein n=1 Tax=Trematosphaeria pertusa TaxID=390896 RepID=A0A6A6IGQ6_9PLEO|nr:uncharacterized protein BU26DRAFT_564754 [Trematosphaeria pertusa]KAF2249072.1 hypothetical protein BU26DRAFT_564754 [Trematosphaeria pertusa]